MASKTKLIGGMCLVGILLSGCQTPPAGQTGAGGNPAQTEGTAAGTDAKEAAKPKDPAALKEEALAQALDIYADGRYDEAIAALTPLSTAPELSSASQVKATSSLRSAIAPWGVCASAGRISKPHCSRIPTSS